MQTERGILIRTFKCCNGLNEPPFSEYMHFNLEQSLNSNLERWTLCVELFSNSKSEHRPMYPKLYLKPNLCKQDLLYGIFLKFELRT
jgi:hypothetical protein